MWLWALPQGQNGHEKSAFCISADHGAVAMSQVKALRKEVLHKVARTMSVFRVAGGIWKAIHCNVFDCLVLKNYILTAYVNLALSALLRAHQHTHPGPRVA